MLVSEMSESVTFGESPNPDSVDLGSSSRTGTSRAIQPTNTGTMKAPNPGGLFAATLTRIDLSHKEKK